MFHLNFKVMQELQLLQFSGIKLDDIDEFFTDLSKRSYYHPLCGNSDLLHVLYMTDFSVMRRLSDDCFYYFLQFKSYLDCKFVVSIDIDCEVCLPSPAKLVRGLNLILLALEHFHFRHIYPSVLVSIDEIDENKTPRVD